jgi:hypothetical protein
MDFLSETVLGGLKDFATRESGVVFGSRLFD